MWPLLTKKKTNTKGKNTLYRKAIKMNKPKDTLCSKGMLMRATYYIAFPVTQLDVCILLSSIVFTVYTDLLRMQRVPAELLLPTGGTSEPHIHNTEASPAKVSLHMKIHTPAFMNMI